MRMEASGGTLHKISQSAGRNCRNAQSSTTSGLVGHSLSRQQLPERMTKSHVLRRPRTLLKPRPNVPQSDRVLRRDDRDVDRGADFWLFAPAFGNCP
jgi:hypothetical protein